MKVLISCEESQVVCKAFRELGHEAYSCDILPCSGGHPDWHIQADVMELLFGLRTNPSYYFHNAAYFPLKKWKWDLIIGHPPCTYLCLSGQKHCNVELYGEKAVERIAKREEAVLFFKKMLQADCDLIALENPIGILSREFRKPDQYISPMQFGHPTKKRTGLWLKGLPKLQPTNIVEQEFHISGSGRSWDKWFWDSSMISNLEERSKFRSTTFLGIAKAMADQWG